MIYKKVGCSSPGSAFAAVHTMKQDIQWLSNRFKLVDYYIKSNSTAQVSTRHLSLSVRTAIQLKMQAF